VKHSVIAGTDENSALLGKARNKGRWPLWLLIFPEGTITSDEERVKSVKYANREKTVSPD
jgi:lysocardiolipin and lysophospholipid acyltransferase